MFTAYQLHLPDDLRIFSYTVPPTYIGSDVVVFDGMLSSETPMQCRSYLFLNRWLEIFITFDANFELLPDPTFSFPFAFNCDITTPYYRVENHLFTTDVCLDVLVAADGVTYKVKDTDAFEDWYNQGAFGPSWYEAAQKELADLIHLLETNQFVQFLTDIAPFPTHLTHVPLSTLVHANLASTHFIQHPQYPRH